MGVVLFELGIYVTLLGMFINTTKVLAVVLIATVVFFLWRKLRKARLLRLPFLTRNWTADNWVYEKLEFWKPDALKSQSALSRMALRQVFRILALILPTRISGTENLNAMEINAFWPDFQNFSFALSPSCIPVPIFGKWVQFSLLTWNIKFNQYTVPVVGGDIRATYRQKR